jgi:hypothetical protein
MTQITSKITSASFLKLSLLMLVTLFGLQASMAQCTNGDKTTFGKDKWIGYVYKHTSPTVPTSSSFADANYLGFVSRDMSFDQNIGTGKLTTTDNPGLCTSTSDAGYFLIRYKMTTVLPAGSYTFTVGGDDGYRFSTDGGQTFRSDLSDWAEHGYTTRSITFKHDGSTLNLVLEYFDFGGDSRVSFKTNAAACTSTAPTAIAGTKTVSCGVGTTLTATGGIAGTGVTYQWGIGSIIGQNVIEGQTGASIAVAPTTSKTYWVRRLSAAPCSVYTSGITTTVAMSDFVYGDPTTFGDNTWNVYAYRGNDLNLGVTSTEYAGYYTTATLGTDSQVSWRKDLSPSSAPTYKGCSISNDNFTFVNKRKGFPCGSYAIAMENWDDNVRLYVNGTQVWSYNGYSGGVGSQLIGTYYLDADATIELRVGEGGGDANAKLVVSPLNATYGPTSISGVNFCCKDATIVLTAMGGTPTSSTVYQWGTGAVGSNIIAGQTGATLTTAQSATTTYWVRASNGSCFSNAVTKTVALPSAVVYRNGAWSGTPTIDTPLEIESNLTISQDLQGCSCQVKNNATVTISSSKTITLKRKLTVDAGSSVEILNNGALVQIDDVQNEGKINFNKSTNLLYRLDYTMWSSPVAAQKLGDFSPATSSNRFYEYKYAFDSASKTNKEAYYPVDAATEFSAAKSYLIRMPNANDAAGYNAGTAPIAFSGKFTGTANNGTVTVAASTQGNRYTAVGNPYASPISVDDFYSANAGVLDANTAIYFWRKKNNSTVSTYATLTKAGYTSNAQIGGGQDQADYFKGISSAWLISQGQGFIVKTAQAPTATVITFTNSMRRSAPSTGKQGFLRSANTLTSRLWLNITDANNAFSQTAVAYIDGATTDIDYGYDGQSMSGGDAVALYTIAANTNLTIQARPAFTPSDIVKMGFNANAAGSYTIALDHVEGVFEQDQNIYLKDNLLGTVTDVKAGSYVFSTEAGTFADRFEVVYVKTNDALGTDNPVLTANNVIVFKQGNTININTGAADMTGVTIYDIQGRKLYSQNNVNATQTTVNGFNAQNEVLIVEINTVKGKVSKKIVF